MTVTRPNGVADPHARAHEALPLRLRIPAFTAGSVGLGVVAHVAAGGNPPGVGMMLLMVAAVTLTFASLTRRERALPWIVVAVGFVQLGMHVALLGGHEHANPAAADNGPALVIAHAVAVVALAWWLRRGEAAAWRAAVKVWRRLVRLPSTPISSKVSMRDRPAPLCRASFPGVPVLVLPVRGPPCLT